ncbi:MAG: serine hydrolase domain-containing protein [Pseudomonadota bacterium]
MNNYIEGKDVAGHFLSGYEAVFDVFSDTFARGLEAGAACAVFRNGSPVVDLWGGISDSQGGSPWQRDTLVPVYSVAKGIAALAVLHLVDQGLLVLDEPVATYWPEFAQHGKQYVTVRCLLSHRCGLPFVEGEVKLDELASPQHMAARLAGQAPIFAPDSTHTYHAVTMGWLTSELVRRVAGESLGPWIARRAACLDIDLWIGLPESQRPRVAVLEAEKPEQHMMLCTLCPPGSFHWKVFTLNGLLELIPGNGGLDLNDYRLQSKELAGSNLITNARSLAKFYGNCMETAGHPAFVSADTLAQACRPHSTGVPFDSPLPGASWGAGVMLPWSNQPMLGAGSFGHDGYGGSLAFADPESGFSFAYVRNRLPAGGARDECVYRLVDALQKMI